MIWTRRSVIALIALTPALLGAANNNEDEVADDAAISGRESRVGRLTRDIAYGNLPSQKLDLWVPLEVAGPFPLCIYFHGGGFAKGDKSGFDGRFRDRLMRAGFAVASVNYRLKPEAHFPAPMFDGVRAIQFLRANALQFRLNKGKVVVSGRSAGGAIALWIAYQDELAKPSDADPIMRESSRVMAAAVINAQTTFRASDIKRLFGAETTPRFFANLLGRQFSEEEAKNASALANYTADDPPTYFLYLKRQQFYVNPSKPNTFIHNRDFAKPVRDLAKRYGKDVIVKEQAASMGREYDSMVVFLTKNIE